MLKITGYPDRYSAAPGERIEFKVSQEDGDSFEARLVRVVHGVQLARLVELSK